MQLLSSAWDTWRKYVYTTKCIWMSPAQWWPICNIINVSNRVHNSHMYNVQSGVGTPWYIARHLRWCQLWNSDDERPRFSRPVSLTVSLTSFQSHLNSNTVIATKLCTWHDSCAVLACAKICCYLMACNGVMARRNFHRIWIAGKNR